MLDFIYPEEASTFLSNKSVKNGNSIADMYNVC